MDYTYPQTGFTFGARDGLPPGNAEKVISGSQFDPEFTLIETAVNSRLEKNAQSGDFIGIIDGGVINGGTY